MPHALTWNQLGAAVTLSAFFAMLTFSRRFPFPPIPFLIITSTGLVLGCSLWNFFLLTTFWRGGENLFAIPDRVQLPLLLVICSFLASAILFAISVFSFFAFPQASMRQKTCFFFASLPIFCSLALLGFFPIKFQKILNSMPPSPASQNGELITTPNKN